MIPELLSFIPVAFMTPIFPLLAKKFEINREAFFKTYRTSLKYLLFFIVPSVCFIYFYMEEVITLFFSDKYIPSIPAAKIVIFSEIFIFGAHVFNYSLISCNKQKLEFIFTVISGTLNIILNLILIPMYGIVGAAIATLISYGFFIVTGMIVSSVRRFSLIILQMVIKPVIAAVIMSFTIVYFDLNMWISLFVSSSIYLVIFLILKGFNKEDIRFIKELIPRRTG